MSLYVCKTHTDYFSDPPKVYQVNWKGKGCSKCEDDHEKRLAKKEVERKRRAARRNGEEFVEEEEER